MFSQFIIQPVKRSSLFVRSFVDCKSLPPTFIDCSLYIHQDVRNQSYYIRWERDSTIFTIFFLYLFSVCKLVSSFVCCARFFTLEPREPLLYSSLYPLYLFCYRSNLELWWYAKKYMAFTICYGSGYSYRQPAQYCSIASNIKHRKNHRNKTFRWYACVVCPVKNIAQKSQICLPTKTCEAYESTGWHILIRPICVY